MPEWCVADFMAELQKEWRTAVWVVVLTLVPIDCAHALLCLDWWCLLRYGRDDSFVPMGCGAAENSSERPGNLPSEEEGGLDEEKEAVHIRKHELDRSRITHDRTTDISTPSHLSTDSPPSSSSVGTPGPSPPYTYHLFLHRRLSTRAQTTLLSIFDSTILTVLAGHITSYILSLLCYFSHCDTDRVKAESDFPFGNTTKLLNARQGCIKLNVDIHISGGFSTFLAIILVMLHVSALVVRGWECGELGKEGVIGTAFDLAVKEEKERKCDTVLMDSYNKDPAVGSSSALSEKLDNTKGSQPGSGMSTTSLRTSRSVGSEERGTGIRFKDRSAGRPEHGVRRRARGVEDSNIGMEDSKWSALFLECLIP